MKFRLGQEQQQRIYCHNLFNSTSSEWRLNVVIDSVNRTETNILDTAMTTVCPWVSFPTRAEIRPFFDKETPELINVPQLKEKKINCLKKKGPFRVLRKNRLLFLLLRVGRCSYRVPNPSNLGRKSESYSKNAIGVKKSFQKKKKERPFAHIGNEIKSVAKINAIITFPTSVKICFVCFHSNWVISDYHSFGQFVRFSQGNSNCQTNER